MNHSGKVHTFSFASWHLLICHCFFFFFSWKLNHSINLYRGVLLKKQVVLLTDENCHTVQRMQAQLGRAILYVTMEKRPFCLITFTRKVEIHHIKLDINHNKIYSQRAQCFCQTQRKSLSTNMKAWIHISYALPQNRDKSSKCLTKLQKMLQNCKHHKLATSCLSDTVLLILCYYIFPCFAVKHLIRHSVRRQRLRSPQN